jgi:hypothetical protein
VGLFFELVALGSGASLRMEGGLCEFAGPWMMISSGGGTGDTGGRCGKASDGLELRISAGVEQLEGPGGWALEEGEPGAQNLTKFDSRQSRTGRGTCVRRADEGEPWSIRVWSRSTLDLERTLIGHTYSVSVLVFPRLTPCLFVGRDNWAMQRLAN